MRHSEFCFQNHCHGLFSVSALKRQRPRQHFELKLEIKNTSVLEGSQPQLPEPGLTIRTPKDHQSAANECPFLLTTSGAMYSTVPQNEYVFCVGSSRGCLLSPKSVSEIWPSASRRMLEKKARCGVKFQIDRSERERLWEIGHKKGGARQFSKLKKKKLQR